MLGYDDKRAYFRMIMNSPCELKIIDDETTAPFVAVCKDISAVGMSFELEETIPMDTELTVSIESSNPQIASLSANVKVVRSIEQESGNHMVGVEIISMN